MRFLTSEPLTSPPNVRGQKTTKDLITILLRLSYIRGSKRYKDKHATGK